MNRLITSTAMPVREMTTEALASLLASFERLCLSAGLETLAEMMEADARAACGPRHARGPSNERPIAGAGPKARSGSTAARWRSSVHGFAALTARNRPFPAGRAR